MPFASQLVSVTSYPVNGATSADVNAFFASKVQEVRTVLENAGWERVSGTDPALYPPHAPAPSAIDVTVTPYTGTQPNRGNLIATDYYAMPTSGSRRLFVQIQTYASTLRSLTTNGFYYPTFQVRLGWAIDPAGLVGGVTASLDGHNNSANGGMSPPETFTIQAASQPDMLMFSYGAPAGFFCRNEATIVIERHHDAAGVLQDGDDAAVSYYSASSTTSGSNSLRRNAHGVFRASDNAHSATAADTTTSSLSSGGGLFGGAPYFFAGPGTGSTSTGVYEGLFQPLVSPMYFGTKPGWSRRVVAIPRSAIPGSFEFDAPNPTGGGTSHYRVLAHYDWLTANLSSVNLVPCVVWEA